MVPVSRGRHDVSVGWMWRMTPNRSLIIDGHCRIWIRAIQNQTMVHHANKSQSAKMTFFSLVEQALHTISVCLPSFLFFSV